MALLHAKMTSGMASSSLPKRRVAPAGVSRSPVLVVRAAANAPGGPSPLDPTPRPPGTPNVPTPPVYLRGGATGAPGGPVGPLGGSGVGGGSGGGRPVSTGGPGGKGPELPGLPSGWTWSRVFLAALGIGVGIAAWKYLNRRYFFKPEPEHTIAKVEDTAIDAKHGKGPIGKAASAVKHNVVEPVVDAARGVKHSDTARAVQHKVEDVKDSADISIHSTSNKAERHAAHAKKNVKHAVEDTTAKAEDIGSAADSKGHEASVKGGRAVQRGKEKVSDAVYDAEKTTEKATKGVFEGIKGAATSVGRKLHVVADATERGGRKAADSAEKGLGVKHTTLTKSDRKRLYYASGGAVLGTTVLGLLYYWDRKGGDLKGKFSKLQRGTKDAADRAAESAKDALRRTGITGEPAKPPSAI